MVAGELLHHASAISCLLFPTFIYFLPKSCDKNYVCQSQILVKPFQVTLMVRCNRI